MKRVTVAVILLASAIGLATLDAHAQGMGGPDDAALKSLPDKPYDPWQGAR